MENTPIENKQGFLQNDRMLVCGMLMFYGACILGVIALTFWSLKSRGQTRSANATSTAAVAATEQANATAIAIGRATEQAQYKLIDGFDSYSSSSRWTYGSQNNDYWEGSTLIKDGVYIWEVDKVKKTLSGGQISIMGFQ